MSGAAGSGNPANPVQDLHFRVTGPVVAQFQEAFADDWAFCTGELATSLTALVRSKIQQSRPLSLADVDGRSLPIKLRDGVARLFSPYL